MKDYKAPFVYIADKETFDLTETYHKLFKTHAVISSKYERDI